MTLIDYLMHKLNFYWVIQDIVYEKFGIRNYRILFHKPFMTR